MVAGCGPKIAKLCLFVFNVAIWAAGLILLSVGSVVVARAADYTDLFSEDTVIVVGAMTIGLGCFTFIVGFCGCCGACKEGTCLLKTYFFLVLLIICAEITAGVLAFVYNDEIEESMLIGMTDTITNKYADPDMSGPTDSIDYIQETFECCGASNFTDYIACEHCGDNVAVPVSCCREQGPADVEACQNGTKGRPVYPDEVWPNGCVQESIDEVQSNFILIGAICFALLLVEILTMVFTCCVINAIEKGEYT